MIDLAKQAGAAVCGFGAAVEKAFQGGGDKLRKEGIGSNPWRLLRLLKTIT